MSLPISDTQNDDLLEKDRGQRDRIRRQNRQEPALTRTQQATPIQAPAGQAPVQDPPRTQAAPAQPVAAPTQTAQTGPTGPVDRNGIELKPGMSISVPMAGGRPQTVKLISMNGDGDFRVQTERGSYTTLSPAFLKKSEVPASSLPKAKVAPKPIAQKPVTPPEPTPPRSNQPPRIAQDANGLPFQPGDQLVMPPVGGAPAKTYTYKGMNPDGSVQVSNDTGHSFGMPVEQVAKGKKQMAGSTGGNGTVPPQTPPAPTNGDAPDENNPKTGFIRPSGFHDSDGNPINLGEPVTLRTPDGKSRQGTASDVWNQRLIVKWDDGTKAAYTPEDISGQKIGDLSAGATTGQAAQANPPQPQQAAPSQAQPTQPAVSQPPTRQGVPDGVLSKITTEYYIYQDENSGDLTIMKGHAINDGPLTVDDSKPLSAKNAQKLLSKYGNQDGQNYLNGIKKPQGRFKSAYQAFKNPPKV